MSEEQTESNEAAIKRLRAALEYIVQHQEIVGGSMAKLSATWLMASRALENLDRQKAKIDIQAEAKRIGVKPHDPIDGMIGQ